MQHPHTLLTSESAGTPGGPSTHTPATADASGGASQLADHGAQLAAEGRFEQAAACFEQALQQGAGDAAVLEMLAQCRMMEGGQDEAAFEAAASAARLRPDWLPALLTLGRAARNAGRLRDAAAAYRSYQQAASAAAAAAAAAGCAAQVVAETAQEAAEEAAAARDELAEVLLLLQRQLGHQLGLPGLVLLERHGGEDGPSPVVWEAGALLAWFLVQQQQQHGSAAATQGSIEAVRATGTGHRCGAGCGASNGCSVAAPTSSAGPSITGSSSKAANCGRGLWSGARVLELGAGGTGIVSLAAACLGAAVTATDLPEVLPQLQASVAANQAMLVAAGGTIAVEALDWRQPDVELLQPNEPYDWLLGADLVYSAAAVEPLAAAVAAAASRPCSSGSGPLKILICHKHRHQDVDDALLAALAAAGVRLRAVLRDATRCTVYANAAAYEALSLT